MLGIRRDWATSESRDPGAEEACREPETHRAGRGSIFDSDPGRRRDGRRRPIMVGISATDDAAMALKDCADAARQAGRHQSQDDAAYEPVEPRDVDPGGHPDGDVGDQRAEAPRGKWTGFVGSSARGSRSVGALVQARHSCYSSQFVRVQCR